MNSSTEHLTGDQKDPALAVERREARVTIEAVVRSLPLLQRELIERIFYEKLTLEQAAREFGLSPRAVLSSLLRVQAVLFWALRDWA
ncbi:MAG: sigma-70 family RNA polymerase sigma factor [Elusimicrobia bacterium]|nr:sigma-70 family RNA polymerase sigma factor [Elusimicrobiota bacterium]